MNNISLTEQSLQSVKNQNKYKNQLRQKGDSQLPKNYLHYVVVHMNNRTNKSNFYNFHWR